MGANAPVSPLDRVAYRLSGELATLVHRVLSPNLADDLPTLLRSLSAACAGDPDAAIVCSHLGLHARLLAFLADPRVEDAAAAVIEVLQQQHSPFPRPAAPGAPPPPPPAVLPLNVGEPAGLVDSRLAPWLPSCTVPSPHSPLSAVIRVSPQHQKSQADVGGVLWPAAAVFAVWAAAHAPLFHFASVLELGSGVGLGGIAAGLVGAAGGDAARRPRVTLTDTTPHVLANLAYNAALNEPWPVCTPPLFSVATLDFCAPPTDDDPRYDVVLATDVVCRPSDAVGLAGALAALLRKPGTKGDDCPPRFAEWGGVGVLCLPPPSARFGVDALAGALSSVGLSFSATPVPPSFAAAGGGEASGAIAGGYEKELAVWVVHWNATS